VAVGGQLTNTGGVIATSGASVDQSRRHGIGTGGTVALIIGVLILIGGTTAALLNRGGGFDEAAGTWIADVSPPRGQVTLQVDDNGT
jgi:hypothetical protein